MTRYKTKIDRIEPRLADGKLEGTVADLKQTVVSRNITLHEGINPSEPISTTEVRKRISGDDIEGMKI